MGVWECGGVGVTGQTIFKPTRDCTGVQLWPPPPQKKIPLSEGGSLSLWTLHETSGASLWEESLIGNLWSNFAVPVGFFLIEQNTIYCIQYICASIHASRLSKQVEWIQLVVARTQTIAVMYEESDLVVARTQTIAVMYEDHIQPVLGYGHH